MPSLVKKVSRMPEHRKITRRSAADGTVEQTGQAGQGCTIVERVVTKLYQGQRPKNRATTICGRRCGHDPQKSHWRAQPVSKNSRRGAPVKEAERRLRPFRLRRVPGRSAWGARECAESAQSFSDRIPAELWHWRRRPAAA